MAKSKTVVVAAVMPAVLLKKCFDGNMEGREMG